MQTDDKKQRLIEALIEEQKRMPLHTRVEHSIAIEYLKHGKTAYDYYDWPLLDAAMNDYQQLLTDYQITN